MIFARNLLFWTVFLTHIMQNFDPQCLKITRETILFSLPPTWSLWAKIMVFWSKLFFSKNAKFSLFLTRGGNYLICDKSHTKIMKNPKNPRNTNFSNFWNLWLHDWYHFVPNDFLCPLMRSFSIQKAM